MLLGTPAFMSPEQARGAEVGPASDLFTLGSVLYVLSCGAKPFDAPTTMGILTALAVDVPPRAHEVNPAVPLGLSQLIAELLAKEPSARPASADVVVERLQVLLAAVERPTESATQPLAAAIPLPPSRSARRSRTRRWLAAAGCLVLGLALVWACLPPPASRPATIYPTLPGVTYLSDLQPIETVNWPFSQPLASLGAEPPEWPPPTGGRRVILHGQASLHGVFMHMPTQGDPRCRVAYLLAERFQSFTASVSLNDGPRSCPPMTFTVYGDGQPLWRSTTVRSQDETQTCSMLSVRGVRVLALELSGPDSVVGTHGVWIEPYLTPLSSHQEQP
jgi:hypothetical protein